MLPLVDKVYLDFDDEKVTRPIPLLEGRNFREALIQLCAAIDAGVTALPGRPTKGETVIEISVGPAQGRANVEVASDGWLVFLNKGVEPGPSSNPVGAYLAACLAVAELFKHFLKSSGLTANLKRPIALHQATQFSTFDYSIGRPEAPNPALPTGAKLGPVLIAGVGSGGSATILTLASMPGAAGPFAFVDPDEVVERNIQRLPFATAEDAHTRRRKVAIAGGLIQQCTGEQCILREKPYQECREEMRSLGFLDLVVGTVHTGAARREIQKDLPRVLLDAAATQNGEAIIRRVFFGDSACMGCFYPRDTVYAEDKVLSQVLGLEIEEIEYLRSTNARFTEDQVRRMKGRGVDHLPEVGEPYGDWRQKCAQLPLFVESSSTEVPAPFVTAAAGVLLAGEIIKERLFRNSVLRSLLLLDTLGRFSPAYPCFRGTEKCDICGDPDMLNVYKERWC
ncbi:MAG: hypothetical protein L0338_36795 [Acidobacteria bacterium]|nr:hypothetical protein [Acidobacteriota bacterium]